jgi:hypothetical protein
MVPRKNLGKQTKLFFPCRAEIQLPGNGIWLISSETDLEWLTIYVISIRSCTGKTASYQQLELKVLLVAEQLCLRSRYGKPFEASFAVQNMLLYLSPSPMLGNMPIRVLALVFDLCVPNYRSSCTQNFPSPLKQERGLPSIYDVSLVCCYGANLFCFLSCLPLLTHALPCHHRVWILTLCRRCVFVHPNDWRGFVEPKKKTNVGLLSIQSSLVCTVGL